MLHFKAIDLEKYRTKTLDELDAELFEKTAYEGMKFNREGDWNKINFEKYSSPIFKFENGDKVAFNKYGKIVKIN